MFMAMYIKSPDFVRKTQKGVIVRINELTPQRVCSVLLNFS